MKQIPRSLARCLFCFAIGAGIAISGCSDDDAPSGAAPGSSSKDRGEAWLQHGRDIEPHVWLATRHRDSGTPEQAELARIEKNLADAHRIYRESSRMIANRAAQIEDMLAERGVNEPAPSILAALATIAGEVGQAEGFGAVSQQYFNLRASGFERNPALEELKRRYARRG